MVGFKDLVLSSGLQNLSRQIFDSLSEAVYKGKLFMYKAYVVLFHLVLCLFHLVLLNCAYDCKCMRNACVLLNSFAYIYIYIYICIEILKYSLTV